MSENAFVCSGQSLDLAPRCRVRTGSRFHLVVDSTGFSIVGEASAMLRLQARHHPCVIPPRGGRRSPGNGLHRALLQLLSEPSLVRRKYK